MRAIKLQTHVEKDHTLRFQLPDDVAEGPAEVIVLVPDASEEQGHTLTEFLANLSRRPRRTRDQQQIDRDLEQERESWGA